MALSKPARQLLLVACGGVVLLLSPLLLLMGSNIGTGMVDDVMNRRPTRAELLGSYRLVAPWGGATLRLNEDNTFTESITEKGGPTRLVTGMWDEMDDSNCANLQFRPFGMVWDQDHRTQTHLYTLCFHRRRWSSTYGMVDDDLGETFEPI